ncbi:MAG: aminopeptidase [Promethearchaeota archaeon]|jgi:aminopeptidase
MINPFYEKLAKLVVNYSVEVKKGDRVLIEGPILSKELLLALNIEVIKAGGYPLIQPDIEGVTESLLKYGSEDQIEYVDDVKLKAFREFDGLIQVFADYNTRRYSLIDPKVMKKFQAAPKRGELIKLMTERYAKGEFKWVIIPYPCQAHAQEANMDLFSFSKFMEKALFLDQDDPIKKWSEMEKRQENIVEFLNKVEIIKVIGEGTDLEFFVKDRIWKSSCGHINLPDGEIYTGPVEDSVNGCIKFSYPGIYSGREIEDIYLEFKDGKVISATAGKGQDLLEEILKVENANFIGEFAIGTNKSITTFIKNMLFDEKMGGTIHCALGAGFPETGSKNISMIHWDILKDMKLPGSKILADNKVIYEEGKWKI